MAPAEKPAIVGSNTLRRHRQFLRHRDRAAAYLMPILRLDLRRTLRIYFIHDGASLMAFCPAIHYYGDRAYIGRAANT